ncbi:MAG: CBS domain-containing protein, partial [Lachnospiraceae bacterium]|nr:CBS domain-containing protein [Lachnospiraceae bacterium]
FAFVKSQTHSRVLAYEKTVDSVVGVLQIRKYLKEYLKTQVLPDVRKLLDPVYFAPQSMEVSELLSEMTKRKLNMAVVTDSFGGTLGVVTVEDIVEEIVGEIWDEDDEIREPIVELTEHTFLARGDETVNDVFDFIGFEEPEEENRDRFMNLFVSDWVYEQFQHIPKNGDSFRYRNLVVTVSEMTKNRINRVMVEVLPEEETEEEVRHES